MRASSYDAFCTLEWNFTLGIFTIDTKICKYEPAAPGLEEYIQKYMWVNLKSDAKVTTNEHGGGWG